MNSQSWDGTQAPKLSEAPLSIGTCRHLWGPPGSGDEPSAALVDECRAQRQGEAGVGQLWVNPPKAGMFLDSRICWGFKSNRTKFQGQEGPS